MDKIIAVLISLIVGAYAGVTYQSNQQIKDRDTKEASAQKEKVAEIVKRGAKVIQRNPISEDETIIYLKVPSQNITDSLDSAPCFIYVNKALKTSSMACQTMEYDMSMDGYDDEPGYDYRY